MILHIRKIVSAVGLVFLEKEISTAALNEIPDRFDHLISTLDAVSSKVRDFTLDFVQGRLLKEEQRVKLHAAFSKSALG